MKKIIAIFLVIATVLLFTACTVSTPSGDGGDTTGGNTAGGDTTQTGPGPAVEGKGKLGDYEVEIKSFRLGEDSGKNIIYITYGFTNNSKEAAAFMFAINDKAFQNGVQCESSIILRDDTYKSGESMKEIQPGTTFEFEKAFDLNDTTSPVTIELTETFSFTSKEKVSKTFNLG